MGIGVIVHGFIASTGYGGQVESHRLYRHNRAVIRSLPDVDEEWPFFTRSMFSSLPLRKHLEIRIPQNEWLIISFGASYKNMYQLEGAWIRKFEGLLSRLCWARASVFVDFSALRYDWEVARSEIQENFFADPPRPPRHWTLQCKRLNAESVDLQNHVDGDPYVPLRPARPDPP
jgi:hypothetical protein